MICYKKSHKLLSKKDVTILHDVIVTVVMLLRPLRRIIVETHSFYEELIKPVIFYLISFRYPLQKKDSLLGKTGVITKRFVDYLKTTFFTSFDSGRSVRSL